MATATHDSLPTRESLLAQLKAGDDPGAWQRFYDTYRGLIYRFAMRAGLNEAEAEDAVQETVVGIARKLPEFRYEPGKCSFKTWLLNQTRWRIQDQIRKRARTNVDAAQAVPASCPSPVRRGPADGDRTDTLERLPDASEERLAAAWDEDWQKTVVAAALSRVKANSSPRDCQMFELLIQRGWSPAEVARTLNVNIARVYLAKHRVTKRITGELKNMELGRI